MMVLVIVFIVAVIIYRLLIMLALFKVKLLRPNAGIYATMSAALVNLVLIMCLGKVYEKLAYKMTQWGMSKWFCMARLKLKRVFTASADQLVCYAN
ncbi:Anoctamin [Paragonimus kellicotti]|nr:Anoctamin [Paragonimus kellicotti]